jgi:DNA-binding NarL/FixJ family response regulator
LLSPAATTRLVAHFTSQPARRPADDRVLAGLTDREREVMACVATGLSNEEISGRLYMSAATARTHVHRAMRKLGARDRAQLVVLAYETGLVTPGQ